MGFRGKKMVRARLQVWLAWTIPAGLGISSCQDQPETGSQPAQESIEIWFREESKARGLNFTHSSGHESEFLFPELMGGGAALFDMDGDNDLDAFLVQSGSLLRETSTVGHRLFANRGDGNFEDVTAASGIGHGGYGMGVAVGDYDLDGDNDLYVTNLGANVLYANNGSGQFRDVTALAGVGEKGWSTSAVFFDPDRDGDLDLFVTNYVRWTREGERRCFDPTGKPDYCSPTEYQAPAQDTFYENLGDGTFVDATVKAGLNLAFGNGLGVLPSDFDDDGYPDLFVANDQNPNLLWMNQGDGTFKESATLRNCALDRNGRARAGMGVDSVDLDDDLDLDFLVVNMARESDGLFENHGSYFAEITTQAGISSANRTMTRFGVGFADFNQDGWVDLYIANGRVNMVMPPIDPLDPYSEPNTLLRGVGPRQWKEVLPTGGTGGSLSATSRGAAFGDVNGDGAMDVLVVNRDGPAHLMINVASPRGHWFSARVLERWGSDAIGAKVFLTVGSRKLRRDVKSAFSYCSASDPRIHVGLGSVAGIDELWVRWLDGSEESFGPQQANRAVVLKRGSGQSR